jgi:hypothetical protein
MALFANPRKTTSVRKLGSVDVSAIRDAIVEIPESVWALEAQGKPNHYGVLGGTQHIIFRFVSDVGDWRSSFDYPAWSEWKDRLDPLLRQATAAYGYSHSAFPRIMLARMQPGGEIRPHVDMNRAAAWPHKIHVPITTNPEVQFYVEPETYHFEVGQAYEVNNRVTHAVRNLGSTPRIHLIFEYYDEEQPVEGC